MKKIKVLQTIRQGLVGGGESHVIDVSTGLSGRFEPVVLSFTEGPMVDTLRERGIKTFVIPTLKAFDYKVWKDIKKLLIDEKIDLIHSHGTRATTNLLWLARRMKIPIVYSVHGWSFHQDQNPIVFRIRYFSEAFLTRFSTQVINVSTENQQTGKKLFKLSNSVVVEYGVNQQVFTPNGNFKDIRRELNIADDTFLVGYIARVTIQKDPETFVKAIKIVHQKQPSIKVLMVGDGDLKKFTVKLIKEHKLEDVIILQPFRKDVPDILKCIDVFCLPSLWEGFSISLQEALAMEKAVVATPSDGTNEIVTNGENGFIVPFSNPEKLAAGILKYYDRRDLIESHGKISGNRIHHNYSMAKMIGEIENIYLKLLTNAKK